LQGQIDAPPCARPTTAVSQAQRTRNRPRKSRALRSAAQKEPRRGFWSIFKHGIVGSFHKVSAKYMPLYVAEFQFRYNNRDNADIFGTAISGC
jgi:hypothetical protein